MHLNKLILLLLLLPLTLTGCGGGISQDEMHKFSLPNDDEEEAAPQQAAAATPGEETEAPAPTAPIEKSPPVAAATPAAMKVASNSNPGPKTAAGPSPADKTSPDAKAGAPTNVSTEAQASSNHSGTPLDIAGDFGSDSPPATNAPKGPQTPDDYAAEAIAALGPQPVYSDDSPPEVLDAWRNWREQHRLIEERKAEMVEAQELAKRHGNRNVSLVTSDSANGDPMDGGLDQQAFVKNLLARLTDPGQLAPDELARVAQELAYADATKEAISYYNGWILAIEIEELRKLQVPWSPGLQRPVSALHWGIGMEYSGARQLMNSLNPIGAGNQAVKRANRKQTDRLDTYVGELGHRFVVGLADRIDVGSLGTLLKAPPDNGNEEQQRTFNLKWQAKPTGFNPESMGRGITLLGGGTRKELLHIARLEGIDILVVYDVNAKQPRSGPVINITTLKLIDVWRDKELFDSTPLNNVKVEQARWDRSQKDPVEKVFEDLFASIDSSLQFAPLPKELKEEHVAARIAVLAASQPANPLASLAEMRRYHALGLIGDAKLYDAYKVLIGDEAAKKLVAGKPADRVAALGQFLPKIEPVKD